MGGMFGGGDAPEQAPVQEAQPPEPLNLKTTGYGGMGPTATPQTFTAQGKPQWMTGWFDMPGWGRSAANPNQALTQQMLQPQVPQGGGGGGQGGQGIGAKDLREMMMMMMSGGITGGPGVGEYLGPSIISNARKAMAQYGGPKGPQSTFGFKLGGEQ